VEHPKHPMSTAYPPPIIERTELTHTVLARAAYGGIGTDQHNTVCLDGAPAPLGVTLAVSLFTQRAWMRFYPDPDGTRIALLTGVGQAVLTGWDLQVIGDAA
jgi:hypothetical protein